MFNRLINRWQNRRSSDPDVTVVTDAPSRRTATHRNTSTGSLPRWVWVLVALIVLLLLPRLLDAILWLLSSTLGLIMGSVDWYQSADVPWLWLLFAVLVVAGLVLLFKRAVVGVVLLVAALLLFVFLPGVNLDNPLTEDVADQARQDITDTVDQTEKEVTLDRRCAGSWKMKSSTPKNGDVVQSVPSIRRAETEAEARAAARDWVDKIKNHPGVLSGVSAYLGKQEVPSYALEVDGCASDAAVALVQDMYVAIALSRISPALAPADGINSGTRNGKLYAYNQRGVTGDRRAIKIVPRDGRVFWVMARCGNPVVMGNPPVPRGNPPSNPPGNLHPPSGGCEYNCTPPPSEAKDPSKDVLLNPHVPDQVKGPGATPSGGDPGAPTRPVDSDTGCSGSCGGTGGSGSGSGGGSSSPSPEPPGDDTPAAQQPENSPGNPPPPPSD